MKTDNGENETQTQHQNDNRVDPQTRALIGVELEHSAGGTARTSRAGRAGPSIAEGFLVVCGRAATQSSSGTTGRSRRRRTVHRASGGSPSTGARRLGVRAGLSTGGQGRGSTSRGLKQMHNYGQHSIQCRGPVWNEQSELLSAGHITLFSREDDRRNTHHLEQINEKREERKINEGDEETNCK